MRAKDRYYGDTALTYEQKREVKPKWQREHAAVDTLLAALPEGASVLDVPVGTGRFLSLYQKYGLRCAGVDLSHDMLTLTAERADEIGVDAQLFEANVTELPLPDKSFDATVCLRLVYSFTMTEVGSVLEELARVTSGTIILSDRHAAPVTEAPLSAVPRAVGRRGKLIARNVGRRMRGARAKRYHRQDALIDVFRSVSLDVEERIPIEQIDGLFNYSLWVLRT